VPSFADSGETKKQQVSYSVEGGGYYRTIRKHKFLKQLKRQTNGFHSGGY
jgi:hypothetical protein